MDDAALLDLRRLGPVVAEQVDALTRCRSPLTRAQVLANLGTALLEVGAPRTALECARESHELATQPLTSSFKDRVVGALTDPGSASRGRTGLAATALHVEGAALNDLGRPEEAVEPLRFAYRYFASRGEDERARGAATGLCSALDATGREDEAQALLDEAVARVEQNGALAEVEGWRRVRDRREARRRDDPAVLEADLLAARESERWPDVGGLALALSAVLTEQREIERARGYAAAAVDAYGRLPSSEMRAPETRARWMVAWLARDSDEGKIPALIDAEAMLREHGEADDADRCRSHVLAALVRRDGWGAATAWAAQHADGSGAFTPPDSTLLAEVWDPRTTEARARDLLRGASDDSDVPGVLQALAVAQLRWSDLDRGLSLLDRALEGADEPTRVGIAHDRAIALATRGRPDEGLAALEQLLADAETDGRDDEAGALAHEVAAWHGRAGDVDTARRRYEQAALAHRATAAEISASTDCAIRDCETNLLVIDGAEPPEGFIPFRSGGFSLSWCDCEPRTDFA